VHVLIAPSWGELGIIETVGERLVGILIDRGFKVTLRPHPQTIRRSKVILKKISNRYSNSNLFELETDVSTTNSLFESDLMITDWSGTAFDYAFGLERPVLFIDTAPKVNNPSHAEIALEPFERLSRSTIGKICHPDSLETVPACVDELVETSERFSETIRSYREQSVFNVGSSGLVGAKWLADRLKASDGAPAA
jgi:YidC/Oxa1 family membrane protein insertase